MSSNETRNETRSPQREVAILGGGCFWCLDAVYREVRGVTDVAPGYCGGASERPSYEQVCGGDSGHAEVVRLQFDPEQVTFRELLEVFFVIHDPTQRDRQGNDVGTQYRSVVFPTTEAQQREAREMIASLEAERVFPAPVVTAVEPVGVTFWPAEEVHFDFFTEHPEQPYCQYVVAPKLAQFRAKCAQLRKG